MDPLPIIQETVVSNQTRQTTIFKKEINNNNNKRRRRWGNKIIMGER